MRERVQSDRITKRAGALTAAFLLLVVAAAPAAAGRLSDKEVRALLQDIRKDVNSLHKAVEPRYRNATVKNEQGEFKVSDVLDNLEKSASSMASTATGRNPANGEVRSFLLQAAIISSRASEGRTLLGAEEEWSSLEPRLVRLAGAYGTDFTADPTSWTVSRLTDNDVGVLADGLAAQAKGLKKPLTAAMKAAKVPADARGSALDNLAKLGDAAKSVGKNARKGLDADAEMERVLRHAGSLQTVIDQNSLGAALGDRWTSLDRAVATLERTFGM